MRVTTQSPVENKLGSVSKECSTLVKRRGKPCALDHATLRQPTMFAQALKVRPTFRTSLRTLINTYTTPQFSKDES